MSEPEIPPTRTDTGTASLGKWLTGSSVLNFALLGVIAVLALIVVQQTQVIAALSSGLSQQREQFTACKDKPATARGCTTPVAAEPKVIVKQGSQGLPGIDGLAGKDGRDGIDGKDGKDGKPGKDGAPGKQGSPPGCALLSTACMGKDGRDGIDGVDGKDGLDGKNGADGQDGKPGADGQKGDKGEAGRGIVDQYCPPDDNDPATDQAWVLIWSQEPLQTSGGVCRAKTAP